MAGKVPGDGKGDMLWGWVLLAILVLAVVVTGRAVCNDDPGPLPTHQDYDTRHPLP